ncbi:hypothetical protein Gotur_033635 [Gossypium turneri]
MADLVAKRDTKAAPPKKEKVPLLCKLFVRSVSFSAKFKILIACKCFQIQVR